MNALFGKTNLFMTNYNNFFQKKDQKMNVYSKKRINFVFFSQKALKTADFYLTSSKTLIERLVLGVILCCIIKEESFQTQRNTNNTNKRK